MMPVDELLEALERHRKVTKASEEDILVILTSHTLEMKKHLAGMELTLRVLMMREEATKEKKVKP